MPEAWTFLVDLPAREYIEQLDGYRREELIAQVYAIAETPFEHLGRTVLGGLDAWYFEYNSDVGTGVRVTVWFNRIDTVNRTMHIEFISDRIDPEADPA